MAKIINDTVPAHNSKWSIAWVAANPKVKGKDAWFAYEVMEEGMTLEDYEAALAKLGKKKFREEIKWNFNRGFIQLMDEAGEIHGERYTAPVKEAVEA
jgi:glutathione peroxidase-family protein